MANTKATLISMEDAPPPEKPYDQMTPEEQRASFVRKVMAQRAEEDKAKIIPTPPPLTARQRAQIEAEQAAGRATAAKHKASLEAQRKTAAAAPPDPREGTSTPVFRPDDYVPNMNQGKKASSSARSSNL